MGIESPSYYQIHELSATLRSRPIHYFSKPGIPHWDEISPAESLLAEYVDLPSGERTLILDDGPCALAACLARVFQHSQIVLTGSHALCLDLAAQTIQHFQLENLSINKEISWQEDKSESLAVALICLPKGRKLLRRWLLQCWQGLRPGGKLYLAGANREGIQPALQDAQDLFGPGSILGYKKGNRIARFIKSHQPGDPPAWAEEAGIASGTWQVLEVPISDRLLRLVSLPGVFSSEQLDEGTAMLLGQLRIEPGEQVVDVGCGYGAIGIAAALRGAGQVDLVDVNMLAVAAANENIRLHQIACARAFPGDILRWAADGSYDLVVSNPPFHSGHAVDYQVAQAFIQDSWRVLRSGGRLLLVANRFIRYDRLLLATFGQVSVLTESGKYHVLQSERGK